MHNFEQYLQECMDKLTPSRVKDAMAYSLLMKGKRVRPQLLFATLKAYGIKEEKGYAAAAAIEMLHTYSLIHDDLPAMDDDTLRRGHPTCHVQFDEATAILAGDGLLTLAFEYAAQAGEDAKTSLAIVKECAQAAGAEGMILGQMRDMQLEKTASPTQMQLEQVHCYKTGKLLTLPLLCGVHIAQKHADLDDWRSIGEKIGLSFQIQDDVLDVTRSSEQLGKNAGSDKANEKATYVALLGVQQAQKEADALFEEAQQLLASMNIHKEPMEQMLAFLKQRKH